MDWIDEKCFNGEQFMILQRNATVAMEEWRIDVSLNINKLLDSICSSLSTLPSTSINACMNTRNKHRYTNKIYAYTDTYTQLFLK